MTENKWIRFEKVRDTGKTEIWDVINKSSSNSIATIAWYGPWRQYVVQPADNTVWNDGCLKSVVEFLGQLNAEHKARLSPV